MQQHLDVALAQQALRVYGEASSASPDRGPDGVGESISARYGSGTSADDCGGSTDSWVGAALRRRLGACARDRRQVRGLSVDRDRDAGSWQAAFRGHPGQGALQCGDRHAPRVRIGINEHRFRSAEANGIRACDEGE